MADALYLNFGFFVSYAVFMFLIFIIALVRFFQSFQLKTAKKTHLTLFSMVMFASLFWVLGYGYASKTAAGFNISSFNKELIFLNIAFGSQSAIITSTLFVWIELYRNIKIGDLDRIPGYSFKFAVLRNVSSAIVGLFTALSLIGMYFAGVNLVSVSFIALSINAVLIIPILFISVIRWRYLYELLKECLNSNSRNGERFFDMTKVTGVAIVDFFFVLIFNITAESALSIISNTTLLLLYIFFSLLPNVFFLFAVTFYFSPIRKLRREREKPLKSEGTTRADFPVSLIAGTEHTPDSDFTRTV